MCTPIEPVVTVREGETTDDVRTTTVSAEPVVTVAREELDPFVTETRAAGAPVVTSQVRSTGQTCYQNPSNAEQRRNAC